MKPFYTSRKFWTSIVTACAMVAAFVFGGERGAQIAALITAVGAVLVIGLGLEDHGKAAASIAAERDEDEDEDDA